MFNGQHWSLPNSWCRFESDCLLKVRIHMHYKRKKSKRNVRCTLCTQLRWRGNSKSKKRISDLRNDDREKAERTTI